MDEMTENKRFRLGDYTTGRVAYGEILIDDDEYINVCCDSVEWVIGMLEKYDELKKENKQSKQQINTMIKDLQTEKETAISKNERIRLDFAITVLEELKR